MVPRLVPYPAPGGKGERRHATRQSYHFRRAGVAARPPCGLDRAMRMLMLIPMLLHPGPIA